MSLYDHSLQFIYVLDHCLPLFLPLALISFTFLWSLFESRTRLLLQLVKPFRVSGSNPGRAATAAVMSSSRRSSGSSRQQSGSSSRISDDQIIDLVSKLREVLPEIRDRRSDRVSASKVLQETCNHIRKLHREVDDLSERLSQLLSSIDADSAEAAIIRSLITQ